MSANERYGSAVAAGDLKIKLDQPTRADSVLAVGAAGNQHKLGSMLMRLKDGGDTFAFPTAQGLLVEHVSRMIRRKPNKWPDDRRAAVPVAANEALMVWCWPNCFVCRGAKYQLIRGTPTLGTTPCDTCRGTGLRKMGEAHPKTRFGPGRKALNQTQLRLAEFLISVLESEYSSAARATQNKLGGR